MIRFANGTIAYVTEPADQWKPNFLDEMNRKVIKSNRCTIRDAKTTRFHRLCESLNFIVFVVLANFLIPKSSSKQASRTDQVDFPKAKTSSKPTYPFLIPWKGKTMLKVPPNSLAKTGEIRKIL